MFETLINQNPLHLILVIVLTPFEFSIQNKIQNFLGHFCTMLAKLEIVGFGASGLIRNMPVTFLILVILHLFQLRRGTKTKRCSSDTRCPSVRGRCEARHGSVEVQCRYGCFYSLHPIFVCFILHKPY